MFPAEVSDLSEELAPAVLLNCRPTAPGTENYVGVSPRVGIECVQHG